ncbi:PREDICTED: uncharacterized protein LOC109174444 [Ipomoea nil]|uniref:uncharacterized protein LOC109174444 n=1 Tax=Ipomoea nil TaxID=35883 RepID=UPI000901A51B|nr:PREDICTED: uncharacterized protein LOC109174444 [Ipomoea nil]
MVRSKTQEHGRARWSEKEVERDSHQWMPVRASCDDDQLLRVIGYEDVSDYLFSIYSKEARLSLVSQFIDFYGGRMAQWIYCYVESMHRERQCLGILIMLERFLTWHCHPLKDFLCSTWTHGVIDDQSVALVCSAALYCFEEISIGWTASAEFFDQAFSMVLPERRRNSYHVEALFNYYVAMLSKHHRQVKLSKVWQSILNELQMYPVSPKLYSALVQISHLYTSPNKLRLVFDEYCKKKPSVINWLFALSFEISRGGIALICRMSLL